MHKSNKCQNYQHSTITRHASSKEHQACLDIPILQKDLQVSQQKIDSQQDKTALVLLKSTHWMAQEGIPLSKFESFHNFLIDVGVTDLAPLQQKDISYKSRYAATELLSSMADIVHAALKKKVN